jgi:hypothetical protein
MLHQFCSSRVLISISDFDYNPKKYFPPLHKASIWYKIRKEDFERGNDP